jgi:hypothetical protein
MEVRVRASGTMRARPHDLPQLRQETSPGTSHLAGKLPFDSLVQVLYEELPLSLSLPPPSDSDGLLLDFFYPHFILSGASGCYTSRELVTVPRVLCVHVTSPFHIDASGTKCMQL